MGGQGGCTGLWERELSWRKTSVHDTVLLALDYTVYVSRKKKKC